MICIGFHGQFASGARLRADMGGPEWLTWAPDWAADFDGASDFAQQLRLKHGGRVVLIGYSLGGDFIARLTHELPPQQIAGIVVYESPLLSIHRPKPGTCPVLCIWNDYVPGTEHRRQEKADSIAGWNSSYRSVSNIVGRHRRHLLYSWRPPFIRHAWDQTLNPLICDWMAGL